MVGIFCKKFQVVSVLLHVMSDVMRVFPGTVCWFNQCLIPSIWILKWKNIAIDRPLGKNKDRWRFTDYFRDYYNTSQKKIECPGNALLTFIEDYMLDDDMSPLVREARINELTSEQQECELFLEGLSNEELFSQLMPVTRDFNSYEKCKTCGFTKPANEHFRVDKVPFLSTRAPNGSNDNLADMVKELTDRTYIIDCPNEKCNADIQKNVKLKFMSKSPAFVVNVNRCEWRKERIGKGKYVNKQVGFLE